VDAWAGIRDICAGSGYSIGEFRCPPGEARWRTENWIGEAPHIVFPGPAVGICQAGQDPIVATSNEIVLYNGDTTYRRQLVSPEGDHSVFVELTPPLSYEIGAFPSAWISATGPLASLHRIVARLDTVDPLLVDECIMRVIAVLRACGESGCRDRNRSWPDRRDAVETVKAIIATRLAERLTLAHLAAEVHYSPFHLARLFRGHTGRSLCTYRTQLRVSRAVDRVVNRDESLVGIAADLGFASHSHMTTAFRAVLGIRPIDLRRGSYTGPLRQLLASLDV